MLATGAPGSQLAAELAPAPELTLDGPLLLAGGVQRSAQARWRSTSRAGAPSIDTPLEGHLREQGVTHARVLRLQLPQLPAHVDL